MICDVCNRPFLMAHHLAQHKKFKHPPEPVVETIMEPVIQTKAEAAQTAQTPQYSEDTLKMLVQLMLGEQAEKLQDKEAAKVRREESKNEMRRMVKKFDEDKARYQAVCNHTSEDGRFSLIGGQTHNDGLYHPFCRRCMKEFPARAPRGHEIDNAVPA